MDCITFRNRKLATPLEASSVAVEHERVCAACAGFAREVEALERGLQHATQLSVPDGLAEQVLAGLRSRRVLGRNPLQRFFDALREALAGPGGWFGPALGAAAATLVVAAKGRQPGHRDPVARPDQACRGSSSPAECASRDEGLPRGAASELTSPARDRLVDAPAGRI